MEQQTQSVGVGTSSSADDAALNSRQGHGYKSWVDLERIQHERNTMLCNLCKLKLTKFPHKHPAVLLETVLVETILLETMLVETMLLETILGEIMLAKTVLLETMLLETMLSETILGEIMLGEPI